MSGSVPWHLRSHTQTLTTLRRRRWRCWRRSLLALHCATVASQQNGHRDAALTQRTVFRAFPEADAYKPYRAQRQASRQRKPDRGPPAVQGALRRDRQALPDRCVPRAPPGRPRLPTVPRKPTGASTEIAWHVTLDLRVVGFEFLRGRNRHVKSLERSTARARSRRPTRSLTSVIKPRARARRPQITAGPRQGACVSIERTTLRSAAKALVVIANGLARRDREAARPGHRLRPLSGGGAIHAGRHGTRRTCSCGRRQRDGRRQDRSTRTTSVNTLARVRRLE